MDTSEQNIKMCEKAEEIQKQTLVYGDYYWWKESWHIHLESAYAISLDKFIWLPRQDQLQEMVGYKGLPYLLTQTFERAVNGGACNYTWDSGKHFTSMEQLWLAFVMKEKFNKVWNGDNWVNA